MQILVVPIEKINPAPYNPRIDLQPEDKEYKLLAKGIDEFGLVEPLVWNEKSGNLVSGHQRLKILIERGVTEVEVSVVNLPPGKEKQLNIALNKISGDWDMPKLKDLLEELDLGADDIEYTGWTEDEIQELMSQFHVDGEVAEDDADNADLNYVPDALFPSDNDWGIPLLDISKQAKCLSLPATIYGSIARTSRMAGTWLFYTEDYRYNALWNEPMSLLNSSCVSVVEPNFSCYDNIPHAVALWRIYQKRWLARYWQMQGLSVIVDMNVGEAFYDINMLGVPKGWKAYATRGYTSRTDQTLHEYKLACDRAGSEQILFIVYGGGIAVKELSQQNGWVWIDEHMNKAKVVA